MLRSWEAEPDIEVRVLPPDDVRFFKLPDGRIALVWGDQTIVVGKILRTLPITDPWRYLIVYDAEGNEIGIITDIAELDPTSQAVVREELERRYHMPKVLKVLSVERLPQTGHTRWRVETDEGAKEFVVPGSEHIYTSRYPRIFLIDDQGNRYEIPNFERLDPRSRRIAAPFI
ncbi:hypothetical protein HRbin17_00110 [bacterium HR17]|jgi:hypothetical protein|uniref:DUF1854 domain-containing protein n=1 Tax=Candidatus Fervidibacter japonicus TaxID=2035412 RepID=A0A2H5X8V4_9BACT|nr:hypothetical protein HRbin17_00110 [bacterium HR17]